ncbi:GGDEF domain-containing protein [Chitinilyticum aquatile]|uniref:GGDEF domain-containing protein n=1 Tax=Chitinilyticum aquatile TaxID=362520 RepID=UPI000491D6C1|nr:GGDEF domain-containing protein [Chitinilyticum aquatile]
MTQDEPPSIELEQLLAEGQQWFVPDCSHTISIMEQLYPRALAAGCHDLAGKALLLWAHSLWALSAGSEAHRILDLAQELADKHHQPEILARADNIRAELHLSAGEYQAALKNWGQCLRQAIPLGLRDLYVSACLGFGNVFVAHGQHAEALAWHEMALDFAETAGDHDQHANALLHICADLNKLGQFATTLQLSHKAEQIIRQSSHTAWLGDWLGYRGHAHFGLGQQEEAEYWLQQAHAINIQTNYRWSQSLTLLALGKVLLASGKMQAAREHLEQALTLISSFGSKPLLEQAHQLLAELFERQGEYGQALLHHRAYHELALAEARQLASTRLGSTLERRMKDVDIRLQLLHTRHENTVLRLNNSRRAQEVETLAHQASHDPLTGILNRRKLDQELERWVEQSQQDGRELSLLMLDLDHFKSINDRFGHAMGDEVLRLVGRMLQHSSRNDDVIARYGGEEFCVLLPGADLHTAQLVAERIRLRIQQTDWAALHAELQVTTSIGIATLTGDDDACTLQKRADTALYRAKQAGRNRVESLDD